MTAGLVRAFRAGLAPAEDIDAATWAERYRVLSREESSVPGRYDPSLVPYAREILVCLSDRVHRLVVFVAGAQVSKSEVGRNWLAWAWDTDPGPTMIVFPTEAAAEETIDERIEPMIRNTPRLAALATGRAWDVRSKQIKLRVCRCYVGWYGGKQSLATRPARYLDLEEADKVQEVAVESEDRDGDPLTRVMLRTSTYAERAKTYMSSTPSTKAGPIWKAWEAALDRRRYWVPCPRAGCGAWQILEWEQVRFRGCESKDPDEWRAISAEAELGVRDVHYACRACGGRIEERERRALVGAGRWQSEGCAPGEHPASSVVAFQLSALYSPFVSWARLVHEYLDARLKGLREVHAFVNGRLGWIVEDVAGGRTPDLFLAKGARHPARLAPAWAQGLVGGADMGSEGGETFWWWTLRAWGAGGRSRLVAHGRADTLAELVAQVLDEGRPVEGLPPDALMFPKGVLVDIAGDDGEEGSGSDQVLRLAVDDPRVIPVRGTRAKKAGDPRVAPAKEGRGVDGPAPPLTLDVSHYKNLMAAWIATPSAIEPREMWEESAAVTPEYARHMASEARVLERGKLVWRKVSTSAANHLWDCSGYSAAGRDMLVPSDLPTVKQEYEALTRARANAAQRPRRQVEEEWYDPSRWDGWEG